jgi:hypothetical protein
VVGVEAVGGVEAMGGLVGIALRWFDALAVVHRVDVAPGLG